MNDGNVFACNSVTRQQGGSAEAILVPAPQNLGAPIGIFSDLTPWISTGFIYRCTGVLFFFLPFFLSFVIFVSQTCGTTARPLATKNTATFLTRVYF